MLFEIFRSFFQALAFVGAFCVVGYIIVITVNLISFKIDCNNHYLKKELKDRNKIIASLLNSRNR